MTVRETQRNAEARRDAKEPTLTFIGYAGEPGSSSYPTYECSGCGSLVTSRNAHVEWHARDRRAPRAVKPTARGSPALVAFQCPVCAAVSHNPTDAAEGYCGACHAFIGDL